jgi:hypothetical protein
MPLRLQLGRIADFLRGDRRVVERAQSRVRSGTKIQTLRKATPPIVT